MIENRFFRSLFTLTASSVLVGGSLLLLTSTAHWTVPQDAETDPSTPDTMPIAEEPSIEFERPSSEIDQARTTVPDEAEADPKVTASIDAEPEAAEPESVLSSDVPSSEDAVAALAGSPEAGPGDVAPETDSAEGMVADATEEPDSGEVTPESVAALPAQPETSRAEQKANEATDQIGDLLAELPPRVIASDASGAATEQVTDLLAATPPAPAPAEPEAAPEQVAALPAPPLPKRKPEVAPAAPQQEIAEIPSAQAKPAKPEEPKPAPRQEVVQHEPTQPKGPWQPMGLAPADQPVPARVPTARPSGAAYASSVWSALARHKPRAGQSGSTTVVFAIGGNGALRALKVGRSSGNARIDQLALATVRGAAPFAPPPSGSASYTIRIDFH